MCESGKGGNTHTQRRENCRVYDQQRAFRVIHIDYIQSSDFIDHSQRKFKGETGSCPNKSPKVRDIMSACSTPRSHCLQVGNDTALGWTASPTTPPPSRTRQELWRAIHSSNKTNGLVAATPVCPLLRRSSLAGPAPQSIFSCFSAFLYSTSL